MLSITLRKDLGFTKLKSLQLEVVLVIATGRDVFGVLPTGYGKSLLYVIQKTQEEEPSIVIVVSPLTAIIEDQVWPIKKSIAGLVHMHRFKASQQGDYPC